MEAPAEDGGLRAHLRLGSATLVRYQLALALALGCERIVCLTGGGDAATAPLRAAAEAVGARLYAIAEPRGLIALVTATDELIAFADGLLARPQAMMALLEHGPAVVAQPIEAGLAAGFERLDLNHADAGAIRIPGRLVERLGELPADCDAFSSLQRIALQAAVAQRILPEATLASGAWRLVRSDAEAHAGEARWIEFETGDSGQANATQSAARLAVRRLGPALLHAGSGNRVVFAAAVVTAMIALVAGRFQWATPAFAMAALAWLLLCAAVMLARVERDSLQLPAPRLLRLVVYGWLMDALLALLVVQCRPTPVGQDLLERGFAPLVLLGLARLVARIEPPGAARWLEDRGLIALALAALALAGLLGGGVPVLALMILARGLFVLRLAKQG
ncbi:MAG: hypothetical protein KGK11_03145 [Sphingomonadales bacterium]|nr:hypothetical protein [Sphingomonadales bacterium]